MLRFVIAPVLGAGFGALMGHFGKCNGGTCPLTSTWWRGALYGGFVGLIVALASTGG